MMDDEALKRSICRGKELKELRSTTKDLTYRVLVLKGGMESFILKVNTSARLNILGHRSGMEQSGRAEERWSIFYLLQ